MLCCLKHIDFLHKCVDKYARTAMYERLNQSSIDDHPDQWNSKLFHLLPQSQQNLYRKFKKMNNNDSLHQVMSDILLIDPKSINDDTSVDIYLF